MFQTIFKIFIGILLIPIAMALILSALMLLVSLAITVPIYVFFVTGFNLICIAHEDAKHDRK